MSNYIASENDPRKKKSILEGMERRLLHAIKHDHTGDQLSQPAEQVRAARLGLFKAKLHLLKAFAENFEDEGEGTARPRANLQKKIEDWREKSVEEIVELYRREL